jgi:hypothetical protein
VPNNPGIPYVGDLFQGATSAPATLTVQQQSIEEWKEPPLPDFWTRPINGANRGWSSLASSWLKGSQFRYSNFQEFGKAPNTPHVMWSKPISWGGITDAQWPGNTYGTMDYEFPWQWPGIIAMNGQIFLDASIYPKYGYQAIDLITGEQIWFKNGTDNGLNNPVTLAQLGGGGGSGPALSATFPQLQFGQIYHYYSVNGNGMAAYLWMTVGTTWYMLDATTGNWILTLRNVPAGTAVTDQDGSLLRYSYNATSGNLLCWNSSQSIPPAGPTGTSQEQWKPMVGQTIDAVNDRLWTNYPLPNASAQAQTPWYADDVRPRSGYTMNMTIDKGLPGISRVLQDSQGVPKQIMGSFFSATERFGSDEQRFQIWVMKINEHAAPYSPMPDKPFTQNNNLGFTGTVLWNKNFTYPLSGNKTWNLQSVSYEDQVFTIRCKETMQLWGYSLENGNLLWGPTEPQPAWDMYGMSSNVAYGKIYSCGYAGILYCYDIKTGSLLWKYTAPSVGSESPYGNYPLEIRAISDGKVFLTSTEHSPSKPYWRGSYLRCVDATNGNEIWKLLNFYMGLAIADGYAVTGSMYDTKLYCIGKGPSATTVSASPKVADAGTSVLIEGTVTDQSAGAKGTPAIADGNMQAWMEYLNEQQIKPTNAQGVTVTLTAIDSNGNPQNIGTTTSDMNGMYKTMWTPSTAGAYTIVASFAGTNAYASSSAETAVGVTIPPSEPTPSPTPVATVNQLSAEVFYAFAAIMIVFMIALAILTLRKK